MINKEEKYNSAVIMHFLERRFDKQIVKQIQAQLTTFDDQMEMVEEINALRMLIKKRYSSETNKKKLHEVTKKSMESFSEEEKEFMNNLGKL